MKSFSSKLSGVAEFFRLPEAFPPFQREATRPAGFWIRALAAIVDIAVVVSVTWALGILLIHTWDPVETQDSIILIYLLLSAIYSVMFWMTLGATPGKLLFRLRVVRTWDLGPISVFQAALRWSGYSLSSSIFGAGYLMAAFHPQKRTIHDLLGRTRVIRIVSGPRGK